MQGLQRRSILNDGVEEEEGAEGADDAGCCNGSYAAFDDRGCVAGELR